MVFQICYSCKKQNKKTPQKPFAAPVFLCQHLLIISVVKIIFNLIILWFVDSCSFFSITFCQDHRPQNELETGITWIYPWNYYIIKMSLLRNHVFQVIFLVVFIFFCPYCLHISLGCVLELQAEYFWWDKEDFSGSRVLYMVWEGVLKHGVK